MTKIHLQAAARLQREVTELEKKEWVGLTQTQVKLLREGVHEESIQTGDSIDWVFYTHINEALKEKNK